jgi:hypothetical protein
MSTTTTAIAWTDATWNPLRGCSRVSTGCEHCYAERQAGRFSAPGQGPGLLRREHPVRPEGIAPRAPMRIPVLHEVGAPPGGQHAYPKTQHERVPDKILLGTRRQLVDETFGQSGHGSTLRKQSGSMRTAFGGMLPQLPACVQPSKRLISLIFRHQTA